MREPGPSAYYFWEDFLFSHIGVIPIELAGEWQPFFPVEHVFS
jgi:hypothetical protein